MPSKKTYTIHDFRIGETVVPFDATELKLVVVDIRTEQNIIICRLPSERSVRAYFPYELEKEIAVKPPDLETS